MNSNFSIIDFNKLNQHEQYDLVFSKGDFVNYYLKGEVRYALYSLCKSFVEVEFNVSRNRILNLRAFEEGLLLDKYWITTDLN
ncbi:hypothetical protein [Aequorivita antarctica]|uniref:Uncharacterized protein n=1 Tax=Aequorivita antarctica TaxID=153266 RepID=A0A5C6YZ72_9FLAO|nr:hypothetical protein [Aequorivita antarctica]TXD72727.1 hypothetical protein ESU54_10925 [Aequorivita antarctica]SRX74749.1 hypothetical protein AEQU3_01729 [Aequorivita antarctica]